MGRNSEMTHSDRAREDLIELLGLDLTLVGKRAAAAIRALSDEVVELQSEVEQLRDQLVSAETEADMDTLVPVFNRRAFERELSREIAVGGRYGTPLSLVFIDLDRFKLVNDRFGHPAGDAALIKVGEILNTHTRETDLVGRLGGDEFGVVLTHAEVEDCHNKARDLATKIAALIVKDSEDESLSPVQIGASYGVAEWAHGVSASGLIAEADQAMFVMKAARRENGQEA